MIKSIRDSYNRNFSLEAYQAYNQKINSLFPGSLEFKICETPLFMPKEFWQKIEQGSSEIIDFILDPNFKKCTAGALPKNLNIDQEGDHPECLVLDFGVCESKSGELIPQLIEMQGFPSLFAFQIFQDSSFKKFFNIPENFETYRNNLNKESYSSILNNIILGDCKPENVILLEIFPEKQKTRVDFAATKTVVGIETVCLTKILIENNTLYYMKDNEKIHIKRIYNRVIFDEVEQQSQEIQANAQEIFNKADVKFVPHPAWFYRISKYTLPFIKSTFVPETLFLKDLKDFPKNLEDYVLKPLFSFAGQGVVIHVKKEDLENIENKENWILQKKCVYKPIIETPDVPAKVEIRLFLFWPQGMKRPFIANNLCRLSKGDMIGVRYNKDKSWVGSSCCYFEK
ncbi:MAG: hypothetical protein QM539_05710 [Alphaproteobacteria bacterium]|nr:hypothetical protein [Alphaproteobacteria bacterium]